MPLPDDNRLLRQHDFGRGRRVRARYKKVYGIGDVFGRQTEVIGGEDDPETLPVHQRPRHIEMKVV